MKRKKLEPGALIEVYWWDILSVASWTGKDDIDKARPPLCRTCGYYYGCHKEGGKPLWIVVNHTVDDAAGEADYTLIPYGTIQRIERLE